MESPIPWNIPIPIPRFHMDQTSNQNVDDNRCSYDHYHDDYDYHDDYVDSEGGETDGVPGGDERRRLEHTCGSWLWISITMLVDAGLWFLSTVLTIVFIVKYNKQSNGEGTSSLPNNNVNVGSPADPGIEEDGMEERKVG